MNSLTFSDLWEIVLLVAALSAVGSICWKSSGLAVVSAPAQKICTGDIYLSFIITGEITQSLSIFIWAEFRGKNCPKSRAAACFM